MLVTGYNEIIQEAKNAVGQQMNYCNDIVRVLVRKT